MLLDARIDIGEGADCPRDGAGCDVLAGECEALLGAGEFGIGESQLDPEGRGLGMDAMAPADGNGVLMLMRPALEGGQEIVEIGQQDIGGAAQLHVEAGIEHVRRGHALMDEARLGTDDLGQMGQKRDDVMLGLPFDLVDPGDVEDGVLALGPDGLRRLSGNDAELRHGIGRMGLDLEPDAEAGLGIPDQGHFGAGIARNHMGFSGRFCSFEGGLTDLGRKSDTSGRAWPNYFRASPSFCHRRPSKLPET